MILDIELKNGQTLNVNDDYLTNTRYENMVTNEDEIRIGVATSSTFDFTMKNIDNILSGKKFDGCKISVKHNNEKQVGIFNASEVTKARKTITIKSEDNMLKFEKDWKGCAFPITTYNLLLNLCEQCGVSLRTEKKDIINSDVTIQDEDGLAGETCRSILMYLCEIFGSYANCDKDGWLCIEYYDFNNIKDTIKYGDCKSLELGETIARRAGVLFINGNDKVQIGDVNTSYIIEENPIISKLAESEKQAIGQRIFERIKYTSLYNSEIKLRTRKDLIEGDVIKVIDKDGQEYICVISSIIIENNATCTIKSFGDIKNTEKSTSTSTSKKSSISESYSTEVYLGRGQNHQRIVAKSGTYTLVEKLITNITSFSKVNLNLFVNFNYNLDKILYFDIFANDKLVKSLKYEATQGFNQFSVGFLSDIDLENANNIFSCKITLEDGDILEIEPFECQISFIVKSCRITDAVATNQYFVEKYNKISNSIFNQNRFTIKNLRERIIIKIPFYTFDVSLNNDGSVMADWYEDGSLEIYGNGTTQNNVIHEIARGEFGGWSSQGEAAFNSLKNETIRVYISGDVVLGNSFFESTTNLEEVHFNGNIKVGRECFYNCTKLTTLIGEQCVYYAGTSCFRDCNLTGTYDFSNCEMFFDYSFFNNPNMDYIYLPRPITKDANVGMEYCFAGCTNLDAVVVLDNATAQSHQVHSRCFENTKIDKFMLLSDVTYSTLSYLKYVNAINPVLYVCHTWSDKAADMEIIHEIENDYGFTVIWYDKNEEQTILNQLGV